MQSVRIWLSASAFVLVLLSATRAVAVDLPLRQWQAPLTWSSGPGPEPATLYWSRASTRPGIEPLALPSAPAQLVAITPCRILDTRPGNPAAYAPGIPLQAGVTVTYGMKSAPAPCNTIPSNAVAYSLNVVAVGPGAAGFLSVFPGATPPTPLTSLLNYAAGAVIANASAVPGDDTGLVGFLSSAGTDLVVDINGYYAPGSSAGSFSPAQVALLKWYPAYLSATFPVGTGPAAIAFDGSNIWVANFWSDSVTKLRASDGAVQPGSPFAVGSKPDAVAFDGANIWVANQGSNDVTKLRASDGALQGTFAVGADPYGIACDGANIWVTNYSSATVTKLRASDGAVQPGSPFAVGSWPWGIACDGTNIWVANSAGNTVTKLRASDGAVQPGSPFAVGRGPTGIAFDGASIWVVNNSDNTVTKLRASDGSIQPGSPFAVGAYPVGIAFDGASIWVANYSDNSVTKLRASDGAVQPGSPFAVGVSPMAIAFDGASIWVTNFVSASLSKR